MIPILAAFDPSRILDYIGPIIVVVFFFLVPILKAVKEARAKQREAEARGPRAADEAQSEADAGRKAWEELLRGNAPATPPPMAAPIPRPPPIQRVEPVETPAEAQAMGGELSDRSTWSSTEGANEDEAEATYDEEKLARAEGEGALREEMRRRADFLARSKEQAARKTVSTSDMSTTDTGIEARAVARAERPRLVGVLQLDTERRAALRRAVVAGEVFGRPLGLRRAES